MADILIENAQYFTEIGDPTKNAGIQATIDGEAMSVPIFVGNRHYDEIMRQVEAGTLTIQEADNG
ncbi:hypothetical protein OAL29_00890 [Candidatus Binatia bacterium]|nr:hypothetical protein [Candidatus Binatia bacterium]